MKKLVYLFGLILYFLSNNGYSQTVTTNAATNVAQTSATLNGVLTPTGVLFDGKFIWGTTRSVLSNSIASTPNFASGNPTAVLANLPGLTLNTTYYFAVSATTNGVTYINGDTLSFTTSSAAIPTVTTTAASTITQTSASLGGNVTADGGATVTERGVVYSLTSQNNNPIIGGSNVTKITSGSGMGAFAMALSNLTPGTSYSFNAYATNSAGTSYGSPTEIFVTNKLKQASNILFPTISNSSLGLSWTNGGGDVRMVVAHEKSAIDANPINGTTYAASSVFGSGQEIGIGNFVVYQAAANSQTITGLKGTTEYYFKVYEVLGNGSNIYYNLIDTTGNPASSTTLAKTAPIAQATNIALSNATISSLDVTWTNGDGDYRIVTVRRYGIDAMHPINGSIYSASTTFGNGSETSEGSENYIVYKGTGIAPNPLTINGLDEAISYTFVVYEFNNSGDVNAVYQTTVTTSNEASAATLGPATWTGATSTAWNTGTNWSTFQVPVSTTSVTIPNTTRKPVITSGTFSVDDLTINAGSWLTINNAAILNVLGDVLLKSPQGSGVAGQIVISATGALNVSGTSTMERYYTNNLFWRYVSSPLTTPTITPWTGFYANTWNASNQTWEHVTSGTTIAPMQGLSVVDSLGAKTITFTGTFNNGNMSRAVTNGAGGENNGWNLVGNPYPSAINWGGGTGITKTNIDAAAYLYNSSVGTYEPCTSSPCNVAAGQGFFVHATTTGTLSFTNACRSSSLQTFRKNGVVEQPQIILEATNEVYSTKAFVLFEPNATAEFDSEYDAYKLMSPNEGLADIYTLTGLKTKLAINALNLESLNNLGEDGLIIPLGLTKGINGIVKLSVDSIANIPENIYVYLYDKIENHFVNLRLDSYEVFINSTTENRFELMLTTTAVGVNNNLNSKNEILIFANENSVFVKSSLLELSNANIYIYDIMGKLITTQTTINSNPEEINIAKSGTYIVKVVLNNSVTTQKVVVQ